MSESTASDLLSQGAQKRARAQLSCVACRQGKLKCNRQHPACDQCIKRNKDSSCAYVAAPQRKKPNQSMKDRIKHLESLVVELYNANHSTSSDASPQNSTEGSNGSKSSAASWSESEHGISAHLANHPAFVGDVGEQTRAFGRMDIGRSETKYVSPAHWEAILDNIAEVRTALDIEERSSDDQEEHASKEEIENTHPKVQSLLRPDPTIKMTKTDIINAIPPKATSDAMISLYFTSQSPSLNLIHSPTFQKEYAAFWQKPQEASLAWIALLLSMLSIAARMKDHDLSRGDSVRPQRGSSSNETQRLQGLCASALILAPYTKPTNYVVEALVFYIEGEYTDGDDLHFESWLLLGITLRLALRMGYHRDGEHTKLSAFEAEMRRRAWCSLYTFDILLSFELGLPSMTLQMQVDVKLPLNLLDGDFGPEMDELPSPRPDTEMTRISYVRTKTRISRVFGRAAEISHGVSTTPASEVLELDKRLAEVRDSMPPHLKVKPLDECLVDPPGLIMVRFNLELLCQKTRCILHRRFLTDTARGEFIEYSRANCIDAALRILNQLAVVDQAFDAGMMPQGWYIASLNTHDFLLAAMVIALDLDKRVKEQAGREVTETELRESEEMRTQLETTLRIWQRPIHRSAETNKASKVLLLMLARIAKKQEQPKQTPGAIQASVQDGLATPWTGLSGPFTTSSPAVQNSPAMQAQAVLTGIPTPAVEVPVNPGLSPLPMDFGDLDFETFPNMFDVDMDWQTWDNYVFNSNVGTSIPRLQHNSSEFDHETSQHFG